MSLAQRLQSLDRETSREAGKREAIEEEVQFLNENAAKKDREVLVVDKAVEILQTATEARRQELRDRVENLVTKGIQAVFRRTDFEFLFETRITRGVPAMHPTLRSDFGDKILETEIIDGHGGGVADVVSFLLRVIVLALSRPKVAPFMVLDESFRHVSPEFLRGVANLLKELNQSAGIQFLMITHKDELLDAADVIHRARIQDGKTVFSLEHDCADEVYHDATQRGRRGDRTTYFDNEDNDLGGSLDGEMVESETTDALARKQRWKAGRPKKGARRPRKSQT